MTPIKSVTFHLSGANQFSSQRSGRKTVLPVVAARRDDRERHLTLIVPSLPDGATNDATGRLTLSWGRSWGVMAWRLAFAFAAGMTTRASEGGN